MSSIGFDFGNAYAVAAVPRAKGIDLVLSDTSNRLIPSCVSYTGERRFMGDMGIGQRASNRRACFFNLPFLLNERLDSPHIKRVKELGAEFALEADEFGKAYAQVWYGGEQRMVTTENMATAILSKVKDFANHMENISLNEVVAGYPGNWAFEKRASLKACCEALDLKCTGVVSQHMAAAVNYYIKRNAEFRAFQEKDSGVVVTFLSIGELQSFAATFSFHKKGVRCLSAAYDDALGAADFDKVIYEIVCTQIKEKYRAIRPDELTQGKSFTKIMKACNAAKKVLSINARAPVNIECLGEQGIDVSCMVTAQEFEEQSLRLGLIERLAALARRGTQGVSDPSQIEAFELIGGASRMQSIKRLTEELGWTSRITKRLNPDECVVVGLGWVAALRSPRHRVPFEVEMADLDIALTNPIHLNIISTATGSSIYENLPVIFNPGLSYPYTCKIKRSLQPGDYKVLLAEYLPDGSSLVHEEHAFTVTPCDYTQLATMDPAFLEAKKVDISKTEVLVELKFRCDEDGFFRITSARRTDPVLQMNNKQRMVPNPQWTAEIEASEKAEVAAADEEYAVAKNAYDEEIKKYEQGHEEGAPAPVMPTKRAVNRTPKEVPETYTEHSILDQVSAISLTSVGSIANTAPRAAELAAFEKQCQAIDDRRLRYEAALNSLEGLIYDIRNDMEWGKYKEHATAEDVALITPLLNEHSEFVSRADEPSYTEELENRRGALERAISFLRERKESHDGADMQLLSLRGTIDSLLARWPVTDATEKIHSAARAIYTRCQEAVTNAKKTELVPDSIFSGVTDELNKLEKELEPPKKTASEKTTTEATEDTSSAAKASDEDAKQSS
ncbi:putative Heat-shock protein [Giardia muris]|uniref:Putative Heat-shock protein n=1 Tax=Giardia muris TaxID=5742 RepID=A0A4Z1T7I2_GIAMU|nr:putative Heat-shock protein [Giardia muris]|eukprot:TNJ30043.1 putative Heat-shock protein [Giardia muris]